MATGVSTDFQLYDDQFYTGMNETIQKNVDIYNAASNNAIRLVPAESRGNFRDEAFIKEIASLVTRRDQTSTSAGTQTKMTSDDVTSPKVSWRFQTANTIDSLERISKTPQEFSFLLGEQIAIAKLDYMLERALLAAVTCFELNGTGSGGNNHLRDVGAGNTIAYADLSNGLKLFGDKANQIVAFVGHSTHWFDLQQAAFAVTVENVAGTSINAGTIPSLGKAAVMVDSTNLVEADGAAAGVDSYKMLGLVENGIVVTEQPNDRVHGEIITGNENLEYRIQGEGDFLVTVKGFSYDKDPVNPNDTALGAAANWSQVASATKLTAGFQIETR